LLDDPVIVYAELDEAELAYLHSQRSRLLDAVEEATGMAAEIRAEGIAMLDADGDLTDLRMPEEGTDGHLTLLVAEFLATALRRGAGGGVSRRELEEHVAGLVKEHAAHWRKDVTEADAAPALAAAAVARLAALDLVRVNEHDIVARPVLARYAVADPILPPSLDLFGASEA
jgi:uncharacterized protein (TIGR02678 family)